MRLDISTLSACYQSRVAERSRVVRGISGNPVEARGSTGMSWSCCPTQQIQMPCPTECLILLA